MEETDANAGGDSLGSTGPWWWTETKQLFALAVPTTIVNLGLFMPQANTASYVGRKLGTEALDGFTLGNLVANIFALSVLWGLFTANDTLSPQAFGARNYGEVGLLAIRGFIIGMIVIVPINIILFFTLEPVLLALGQPAGPAAMAAEYYNVYMLGLPFFVLYNMAWKFLAAQEITKPLMIVFGISCVFVLPVSLWLFVDWLGLVGSAVALDLFIVAQALLLVGYLAIWEPHHPGTWQGMSQWRKAMAWEPVRTYLVLGFGGMLASMEWLYWECFILVVGSFGVISLAIQTIVVQLIMVVWMIPLSTGLAISVRIGVNIAESGTLARRFAFWMTVGTMVLHTAVGVLIHVFRKGIFMLFTDDEDVIAVRRKKGKRDLVWSFGFRPVM